MAFHSEGAERRWVRQAVMGVLRWRDLPGTRSSLGGQSSSVLRPAAVSEVGRMGINSLNLIFLTSHFPRARGRRRICQGKDIIYNFTRFFSGAAAVTRANLDRRRCRHTRLLNKHDRIKKTTTSAKKTYQNCVYFEKNIFFFYWH